MNPSPAGFAYSTSFGTTMLPGQAGEIYTSATAGLAAGKYANTFVIGYNDGDFTRSVTVTCNGTSP